MGIFSEVEGMCEIVKCVCGMFCIVGCLLCWVIDFVLVEGDGCLICVIVDSVLIWLGVDYIGLDSVDWCYLMLMVEYYGGGLVGVEMLFVVLLESCDVIEEVIELFLMQQGLVVCMLCGWMLVWLGWCYLGLDVLKIL